MLDLGLVLFLAGPVVQPLRSRSFTMNSLITRGSLFDDFFKDIAPGFYVRPLHGDGLPSPSQIKVDVKETDGGYTVQAEVPGVPKEDIHVSIEGNVVSLRAEVRQHDQKTEGEKVLRSERYFGSVARSFAAARRCGRRQAKAKYDNGVLTLTLPKKQGGNAQRPHIE
jgi:HSP20 family protein